MTPHPPSSSDGSALPPRHRPSLGNLAKDTTETDLWAFDEELDEPDGTEEPPAEPAQRSVSRDIPAPRERQGNKPPSEREERQVPKTPTGGEDRIRMNVNKVRATNRPSGPVAGQSKPERDFDDLDNWSDAPVESEIGELPAEVVLTLAPRFLEPMAEMPVPPEVEPLPEVVPPPPVTPPVTRVESDDEFSPVVPENAVPVSLRPHLGLTNVERIGMVVLILLLMLGMVTILVISLNGLPTETKKASANDFPIPGRHVTITHGVSYWRAPVTEGPNPDTVRRDTLLLPVAELTVTGGPAALRILFRNEDHAVVGDAVTRAVTTGATLKIPATAGFEDLGMYAAYRTGESKPWTIEVYEALSETTAGKDFKKLFEMNISTDRR